MKGAKKQEADANVVPFTGQTEETHQEETHQPSYEEIVEILSEMDDVEYDRCRHAKALEWGLLLETLNKLRKQAVRVRQYRKAKQSAPPEPSELKKKCAWILNSEGILDLWIEDWDEVIAGEHRNAKLLYLIATSRLFSSPMHAAIKGPSSAGKSQIRKLVLKFFPDEDVISFTALSEKALIWEERDFCNKILSMAEATDTKSQELQDMLLRELMSEGVLRYRVAQVVNGRVQTIEIVKSGPVSFLVTTTKAALHPENETRMISLEVDDSEAQTKRVLKKQAKTFGRNVLPDACIYEPWQAFQRLLHVLGNKKPNGWVVDVPFAEALAGLIPPRATRLRRDYPQVLSCIKAHAVIHFTQRKTGDNGEVIADLDLDYAPVAELIGHIAAEGAGIAVSKELLETINAVKIITSDVNMPKDDGANAYEVGKLLGLDKSPARRRLLVAAEKGFVVNLETRRGQPGKYRLTDQEVEAESLLPSVDEIRAYESFSGGRGRK